ncbi:hypothetical protein SAMN04488515_1780 [Cognatiyoonia koreensis]|uniref:AAA+ family ATPase n=1 Tax=Cognatiyoonia koreensis TaxID=364200 RepID=A0A1I0QB00_9RHOB|nr:hypothetical protein [Cognatiyoonia koreensis]SEW23976.1 hypothetical protein SAMN04488515_1780 [Cognatiyoonia koreensis]
MKQIAAFALALSLVTAPATAQEAEEGVDLMQEGAELLLRGLMNEMEPAIDDLKGLMEEFGPAVRLFADEMGPVLAEMLSKIDDIKHYEQPEFLPNGDIIIRRSPDAPPWEAPDMTPDENEEIEL